MHITDERELEKVSYLKIDEIDGRAVPLQFCYLGNSEWESWAPTDKGLIRMQMVDLSEGCYFSKEPACKSDSRIGFVEMVMKRAYFNDLVHFEKGILEDINNLTASVAKINLFHELWLHDKTKIKRRFVTTELEYIFKVCRSLFDLLQEVISKIWSRFIYLDSELKTKKLKPTFSQIVFYQNKLSTAQEIADRWLIPIELAEFYHRSGRFFQWLRSFRDKISHGGNSIEPLYIMDEGFAISIDDVAFKGLHIWEKTEIKKNGLGSVRALVAYTILNTLYTLEDFSTVIQSIMQLPYDIAPDYRVFIRGENIDVLHTLHTFVDGREWV